MSRREGRLIVGHPAALANRVRHEPPGSEQTQLLDGPSQMPRMRRRPLDRCRTHWYVVQPTLHGLHPPSSLPPPLVRPPAGTVARVAGTLPSCHSPFRFCSNRSSMALREKPATRTTQRGSETLRGVLSSDHLCSRGVTHTHTLQFLQPMDLLASGASRRARYRKCDQKT